MNHPASTAIVLCSLCGTRSEPSMGKPLPYPGNNVVREETPAMKTFKGFWGLLLLVVLVVSPYASAFAADIPSTLRFGLLPAEQAPTMVADFKGIADHVGAKLGLPTKVWVSESYNILIEAMRAGHLDIAYIGAGQYVAAKEQKIDVVPLVVAQDDTGRGYYKASIIVRAASDIKSLADLKGKTFAFVTPTSTSGGVAPRYFLVKNGLDPEKDFKRVVYAGKHDSVLLAVMNEKVDAGAVGDVYFPRWKERGIVKYADYVEEKDLLKDGDIRILGAQKVPGVVMVARGSLGKDFLEKLKVAFQTVPKEILSRYRIWGPLVGFTPVSHEEYEDFAKMRKLEPKK